MSAADFLSALREAGGVGAPRERSAQLRRLLVGELDRGTAELARSRSGYPDRVVVAFTATDAGLLAVCPVDQAVRVDPAAVPDRAWTLTAGAIGALVEAADIGAALTGIGDLALRAGSFGGHLALALGHRSGDAELAAVAYEVQTEGIDRLRTCGVAVPAAVLDGVDDLRSPLAGDFAAAEAVARLGGRPADGASLEAHADAIAAVLASAPLPSPPHADPDPSRRIARRILQRLNGMGKWGGYHTEFAHLSRGFAGHERALAQEVGEALIAAGLLREKPSVGQRHVFLDPRRAAEIRALIDDARVPPGLRLPTARGSV